MGAAAVSGHPVNTSRAACIPREHLCEYLKPAESVGCEYRGYLFALQNPYVCVCSVDELGIHGIHRIHKAQISAGLRREHLGVRGIHATGQVSTYA